MPVAIRAGQIVGTGWDEEDLEKSVRETLNVPVDIIVQLEDIDNGKFLVTFTDEHNVLVEGLVDKFQNVENQ